MKKALFVLSIIAVIFFGGFQYQVPGTHPSAPTVPFGQDGGGQ
jgi:hypothetical protein